jgi:DNA-binding transcriptional LysR family regulator
MDASLDTRQLQAFVAVSRTGSMSEAARGLFLTPSAVSHAIRELEERVQCRLLDRRNKHIELTLAGEQLLKDANQILSQMASARASLEHMGKWGHDRIRFAANDDFSDYILPTILKNFYEKYPHSHLASETADTFRILELVGTGKIDLGFGLQPPAAIEEDFSPCFEGDLVVCVSPKHHWAGMPSIEIKELSTEPFLGYRRATLLAKLVEGYFHAQNVDLNFSIETGHLGFLKEAIASNLGVGLLPAWTIGADLRDGRMVAVPLQSAPLRLVWGFISHRGRRLTLAEETFMSVARSTIKGFDNSFRSMDSIGIRRPR